MLSFILASLAVIVVYTSTHFLGGVHAAVISVLAFIFIALVLERLIADSF